jgi:hypothetical protein
LNDLLSFPIQIQIDFSHSSSFALAFAPAFELILALGRCDLPTPLPFIQHNAKVMEMVRKSKQPVIY